MRSTPAPQTKPITHGLTSMKVKRPAITKRRKKANPAGNSKKATA
jgi:hypothetical protein